ncbi:protein pellino isoform X2 [Ischnura elegans]|uniref:protein pellino isoform X2 n=1 Tax=Ischnura elegans TaxID=197161 RepID=UPI001ED8B008|nr:protein pellino isoform X2 [Ischnura elegans]
MPLLQSLSILGSGRRGRKQGYRPLEHWSDGAGESPSHGGGGHHLHHDILLHHHGHHQGHHPAPHRFHSSAHHPPASPPVVASASAGAAEADEPPAVAPAAPQTAGESTAAATTTTPNGDVRHHPPSKQSPVKYGELVILGYNGFLPSGDRGRRRSKFVLYKRPAANGVKRSKHYVVKTPHSSQAILDTTQHSISYTLSRNQAIIVEYMPDEDTDMFQIGRSSESPIDFVVVDTVPGGGDEKAGRVMQSTISRFACRILAERKDPRVARIYAAGFDSSRNIFLGEKATKWQSSRGMDGLTTNGVLIMHPRGAFSGADPPTTSPPPLVPADDMDLAATSSEGTETTTEETAACDAPDDPAFQQQGTQPADMEAAECGSPPRPLSQPPPPPPPRRNNVPEWGVWREVSVGGGVFTLRESRSAQQKGHMVEGETNILLDGTLIDLCGATLLWRSAEGLAKSPTKHHLERQIDELNAGRPQCPVGLNTLVIPRKVTLRINEKQQPYVYLNCGHVQGHHDWGQDKDSPGARRCPMCLEVGPVVTLIVGIEPAFYVDNGPPTFAFNPCGHMASEKTVKYWASVPIPHGTNGFDAMCPFCATPLAGFPGYAKLIFQDNVD